MTPLTRSQVARRLGVTPERIRQLTLSGQLTCTVTPLGRLYDSAVVERLAEHRHARGLTNTAEIRTVVEDGASPHERERVDTEPT